MTRRRGRWITSKIMEIYVQENSSLQFMPSLPSDVKNLIVEGMILFPWVLVELMNFNELGFLTKHGHFCSEMQQFQQNEMGLIAEGQSGCFP